MKKIILILLLTSALMSGCATIISGSRQTVSFSSEPNDAIVYVVKRGEEFAIGKTPTTVNIRRTTDKIIVKKEGYRDTLLYYYNPRIKKYELNPQTKEVTKRRVRAGKYYARSNGWVWGNIVLGGPVGVFVDVLTGAYIRLDNNMNVALIKNGFPISNSEIRTVPLVKSKTDRLRELKIMFDEKLITKEDYENGKKKILNEKE